MFLLKYIKVVFTRRAIDLNLLLDFSFVLERDTLILISCGLI